MKTTGKDIILLCKGWYDKNRYSTILDALKEYYRKNYNTDMENYLNEKFLFFLLKETMWEIAKDYPDRLVYFVNRFLSPNELGLLIPNEEDTSYIHQMFYRIVMFLNTLQMRGNGFVEIDTDDYFYEDIDEEGHECRKLMEDIV